MIVPPAVVTVLSGIDERTTGRRAMLAVAVPESDTATRGSR
jgi:hypothetical protein